MGLIRDIIGDTKKTFGTAKMIREEDALRLLSPDNVKGYRLPIVYANNDYLLSKQAAWKGFQIPAKPWGFLDEATRRQYFYSANSVFSRIFPSDKENAGHMLVTNHVYTADDWEESLLHRYRDTASPYFAQYVQASRKFIEQREFFERECYLFTRMGSRGNRGGIRGYLREIIEMVALGAGMDDSQPDRDEQAFWSQQAASATDQLSTSWLSAAPLQRRHVEWLVRHLDTPSLPTPDIASADDQEWSAGHWRSVLASDTREVEIGMVNKDRITGVEFRAPVGPGNSYAVFLALTHIPNELHFERNWVHHASSLDFPVDAHIRFEVIDPERAEKELERPISDAEAQEEEDTDAGVRADEETMIQQRGLRQVKTQVRMNREPLAYWQAVFSVSDTDKERLTQKVARLIKHYKDIHFDLEVPVDDQRELFYQSFVGNEQLIGSWTHRTDTLWLATSAPWLTSSVGDSETSFGLYQGFTIIRDANGIPQKGVPVFYDLQNVVDDEGKAPTEVICGFPGSGKTVSRGLKVAHEDALRGITQFIWDPKGDFLPLKRYAKQMRLDDAKVKLVDLYDPNVSVSLDIFSIAEVDTVKGIDERESAAIEMLSTLCSDYIKNQQWGLEYQQIIQRAVSTVVDMQGAGGPMATMAGVHALIAKWRGRDFSDIDINADSQTQWSNLANMLDDHLKTIRKDTLGQLLFRDPEISGGISINAGDMVIFVAMNMRTTDPGAQPTNRTIIADVISGLMTDFIRSLLFRLPDEVVKSAIFDEWHVIKRTSRAEALLDWLRRMGRSKRCMVRQMSQSATDFTKGSLSTVWCGYAQNDEEAEASCGLLGIEPSRGNIGLLKSLRAGQFLFKDVYGRVAQVQVDIWDDWLLDKFNTQAKDKGKIAQELLAETDAPVSA